MDRLASKDRMDGRRPKLSASTISLHRFRLPKCRTFGRLRRWASTSLNFFSSPGKADDSAVVAAADLNLETGTPPPKPPRLGRCPSLSSLTDRADGVDGEGSLWSVSNERADGQHLVFRHLHPSLKLWPSTPDGSLSTLDLCESSGAATTRILLAGEEGEVEFVRTSGDETHPSGADDDDDVVDDDQDDVGKPGNRVCGDQEQDKSRLFFTKLLRWRTDQAFPELGTDFRLEEARLLWRHWRLISLITPVRQLQVSPVVFFFFN